jgi:hypothetical protein
VTDQSACERDALLLAAGQHRRPMVAAIFQADLLQRRNSACPGIRRRSLAAKADDGEAGNGAEAHPDVAQQFAVERQLPCGGKYRSRVVIGAGIRLLPHSLSMFEAVINAVHRAAPDAAIAFNTRPEDSADAAARWLKAD